MFELVYTVSFESYLLYVCMTLIVEKAGMPKLVNRHDTLPYNCIVRTCRKRSCNQKVVLLLEVT